MSHEIRTPMNAIIGMSHLALETELTPEQQDYLESVRTSSDSLLSLINDILDFSKIEAGHLELDEIPFNLRVTMESVMDTLALKAHEKGLEFTCHIPVGVEEFLNGDPGRLRQILMNLGVNAIKFTEKGEVSLACEVESQDRDEVFLHFTVSDTGIGIPEEKLESIFESFRQADGFTTRQFGGTGLGLSISRQLTEMMEGRIWAESPESSLDNGGPGSAFHFTARFGVQSEDERRSAEMIPVDISNKRILGVDDNQTNRRILKEMVSRLGVTYDDVESGEAALKAMAKAAKAGRNYDLVITDGQMPKMDGFELSRRIKKDPAYPDAIIIMLTSLGLRGDVALCRELGISAYLVKPMKRDDLLDAITAVLGGSVSESKEDQNHVVTRHTMEDRSRFQSLKILLAEDNEINQKMTVKMLENEGHSITVAGTGQKALEYLEREDFDLVLMDVQMPVMDGLEATRQIRQAEAAKRAGNGKPANGQGQSRVLKESPNSRVPIIAMTAHAMKGDKEKCLKAGMDDYISKPIDPKKLIDLLYKWNLRPKKDVDIKTKPQDGKSEESDNSPLNLEKALVRVGGDTDFLKQMFQHLTTWIPQQIDTLTDSVNKGDVKSLIQQAHSLKGAATTLGANEVAATASQLEKLGREEKLSAVNDILIELSAGAVRLIDLVKQIDWSSV